MSTEMELEEREETKVLEPEMLAVYLLNDNYSTFDFVVKVLTQIFRKTHTEAEKITMIIHNQGKALVGLYTRDIALTKVNQVEAMATKEQYPLKAVVES